MLNVPGNESKRKSRQVNACQLLKYIKINENFSSICLTMYVKTFIREITSEDDLKELRKLIDEKLNND